MPRFQSAADRLTAPRAGANMAGQAIEKFARDPVSAPALAYEQPMPQLTTGDPAADPDLRRSVVRALAGFGTNSQRAEWAATVVGRGLKDSDPGVRAEATNVFQNIRGEVLKQGFHE